MRNFQDTYETRKRLFISAFSICMAVPLKSITRGSSTLVASRTMFFVTTVNSWESLIVDTKVSILVALGALDSPLCKIKMSKLEK